MCQLICEWCGKVFDEDELEVSRFAGNVLEPPETLGRCPYCGSPYDDYIREVELCEVCGEPIVERKGKHNYETHSGVCADCGAEIDKAFKELFDDYGREAVLERAEQKDWYSGYGGVKK